MYNMLLLLGLAALSGDLASRDAAPDRAGVVDAEGLAAIHGKLQRATDEQRYEDALFWTKALMAHPDFAVVPKEGQAAVHYLLGVLNLQLGQPAAALPSLIRATDFSGSTLEQWRFRLDAHGALLDRNGTVRALTTMLGRFPETAAELSGDFVLQSAVSPEVDRDAAFALRLALLQANWTHEEDSWVWLKLTDDLLDRDRAAETAPVIARISAPGRRLQFFAMRRYDAVRPAEAIFDVDAAYDADLERAGALARETGATIRVRNAYVSNLLDRGRFDEALAAAESILADPQPDAETDAEAASDLTWVMDNRARLLLLMRRGDEAVAQQRTAAARDEYGQPNVSQTINLGAMLVRLARYEDALAAVASISEDSVSAYGWMQALRVRACAAHRLSDSALAAPAFAHLDAHWRAAPTATYAALACRGDEDGMARLLKEILSEADHQSTGVAMMHRYLDAGDATESDTLLSDRHKRVMARPDVVAARDAVARGFDVPTISAQL